MNTIFFGTGTYVLPILEILTTSYPLKLVITTEKTQQEPVSAYCKEHDIPFISVSSVKDLQAVSDKLQATQSPFAVLANFGVIVTEQIISLFPKGIINVHPSLLPSYRGPTPGQTPLVLGDTKTGVSIMLLDKEVDHGPLLGQENETILPTDTAESLYLRLFAKGAQLLQTVLPEYIEGRLIPKEQDHTKATYTKHLTRESGFLDATKSTPAELLNRMIRAYYPWPGVWTIWKMDNNKEKLVKFLPGEKIQVEGKKPRSYKDFINGYPEGRKLLQELSLI